MAKLDLKIFKLNRLKFEELYEDCQKYLQRVYNMTDDRFTESSAFGQLLSVILHLGRMILFFIEDSITSLKISSSYRPSDIKALAGLTGHNSARPVAARAAARIVYKETGNQDISSQNPPTCYIPNKVVAMNALNGLQYVVLFNSDAASLSLVPGNYVPCYIIQGAIKTQMATGTGYPLQSYAFAERNYSECDEYFVNVYVNGELWPKVNSLLDLGFDQKGVIVKSNMVGTNGGISLFFGNGTYGAIPPSASTIICEYLSTDGIVGNISKEMCNSREDAFQLTGTGYLAESSEPVNLNENFSLQLTTDCIFGTESEDVNLTQQIAPHVSRSFVLANETNYKYFFARMNMFSTIEVIKGYATKEANSVARVLLEKTQNDYNAALRDWKDAIAQFGENSVEATHLYQKAKNLMDAVNKAANKVADTDMNDNTVYILLIPDITKRMSSAVNYFTCPENLFTLSSTEQANLIQMIEDSGQKIITMENRIIDPKKARFSINANVKIWEGYNKESVYANSLAVLSDYFITNTRKDMIPVSDITALLEGVEGIDSVKVWFDADVNNQNVYGQTGFYGIDSFGDVVLTRNYTGSGGVNKQIRDILPLFRGGFTSPSGVEYSAIQSNEHSSAFNLNVVSYTQNTKLSLDNPLN